MKRRGLIVAIAFCAVPMLVVGSAAALDRGSRAPEIGLIDMRGNRVSLASLKGKVVLIDFWASWCKPCKEEMPVLERLHKKYGDKGLVVVGVSVDKDLAKAKEFVARNGVSFPIVHDAEHAVASRYAPAKMPSSFLVDKTGVIRFVHEGFQAGDAAALTSEVESLLAK
jgi:cytochrome c biogenesis protein CcmG/thiol:disulfide interchange protein DsbE